MHFARNLLQTDSKAQRETVAAALRSVLTQQSAAAVEEQWDQVAAMLSGKFTRAAELMASAHEDVLAFRHFSISYWGKLWSTNLLERSTSHPRRGHLSQRHRDHPPGGGRAAGAGRALAAGGPSDALARLDGGDAGGS